MTTEKNQGDKVRKTAAFKALLTAPPAPVDSESEVIFRDGLREAK